MNCNKAFDCSRKKKHQQKLFTNQSFIENKVAKKGQGAGIYCLASKRIFSMLKQIHPRGNEVFVQLLLEF